MSLPASPKPSSRLTPSRDVSLARITDGLLQEGTQFVNRCTKPSQKEYVGICKSVAIGFAVMGFIGFFVKLIHIPINTVLVSVRACCAAALIRVRQRSSVKVALVGYDAGGVVQYRGRQTSVQGPIRSPILPQA
jgi:protein transport protein SEC61 subunit gamma-like protein